MVTPRLQLISESVVFRNPNPGYRSMMAANSNLAQASDGLLLCAYNRGQAYYHPDMEAYLARSHDGGATWIEHSLIYDGGADAIPYTYNGPMLTRLCDGTLVVFTFRRERREPEEPIFNEATGGLIPVENVLFLSTDNGFTWQGPRLVPHAPELVITPSSPLVELDNGDWLLHFDQWHPYDDPGPYRPRSVILISPDRGESWGTPITFGDGAAQGKGFWHGRIIKRLDEASLFTLFWSGNNTDFATLPTHWCKGSPDGQVWSHPQATNYTGQTNWPVDFGAGRMGVIYTEREQAEPGLFAALSLDGGLTWDTRHQVRVWDATGRDKLGVHAPDTYPRSHDTIAFGGPNAIRLADGDMLASFWCTEMSVTQVRCARLRVIE